MQDDDPQPWEPVEVHMAHHMAQVRGALETLVDAPGWPGTELLTAFRLKARMEGLPKSCPMRACRRGDQCRAPDIGGGAACTRLWAPLSCRDFEQMALGVLVAWQAQCMRAGRLQAQLARWPGPRDPAAPLPRGSRRGLKGS